MDNGLNKKRMLLKPIETVIIIFVLIISVVFILKINVPKESKNVVAQIMYDGKIIKTIYLSNANNQILTLDNNPNVSFEVKDSKIRFINTKCHDKLCENIGFISKINSVAICMPNKVSLKIIGNNQDVDIIIN